MFSFTTRSLLIYSFALVLILFHAFADARLVRTGGRGTYSDSSSDDFLLISDIFKNQIGLTTDFVAIQKRGKNSQDAGLLSVPRNCMNNRGTFLDYNFEISNGFFVDEPCYYEFSENEQRLQLTGSTPFNFDLAASAEILWTISQIGSSDLQFQQNISAINGSEILLDVLMPPELIPGEYEVELSMTLFSGPDATFYKDDSGEGNSPRIDCDSVSLVCGYSTYSQRDTMSLSARYIERLVIRPAAQIPEPNLLAVLTLGLIGLIRRKQ